MDNLKKEQVNPFINKTITLGWDMVTIYNKHAINFLLDREYINNLVLGSGNFKVINWTPPGQHYQFKDLALGRPVLSFENSSMANSRAILIIPFISGDVYLTDKENRVTQKHKIIAAQNYYIKMAIEFITKDNEDEGVDIIVDLSSSQLMQVSLPLEVHAEIFEFFKKTLLIDKVYYKFGTISTNKETSSSNPIILRTKNISGSNENSGALLVFMMLNNESGVQGNIPSVDFPAMFAENNHITYIVANHFLFSNILGEQLRKNFSDTEVDLFPITEEHNTAYGVGLSKGYINSGIIYEQKSTRPTLTQLISGTLLLNKPSVAATQVAINGLLFKPGLTPDGQWQITAEINEEQPLITRFVHSKINDFGGFEKSEYLHHSSRLDFSAHYAPEFMESGEITLTNTPIKSVFNATINNIRAEPFKTSLSQLSDDISNALTEKIAIDIPDIYDLTKQVVSLSNHSKPKFSSLEIPGDMFLEGQLESAGQIEPAYSTLLANQQCQFSISDDVIRTWEISPASMGSIDANTGLYCAPKTLTAGLNQVVITATDAQGNQRHALCNLQASIAIETSFLTIREKENIVTPLQFKAMLDPSLNGKLTWKLLNASNSNIGSLTPEGLYYPPILGFNPGYTFITIQVSAENGESDQAIICLVSANTFALFVPSPSGTVLLSNGDEQHFTCQGDDDFPPDHWEIHPQIGLLSPSLIYEDGVKANSYSAVYTAPDNGEGNQTVMLTISSEGKPYFATYVMIELGAQS